MKIDLRKIIFASLAILLFLILITRIQPKVIESNIATYQNNALISYKLTNKQGFSVEVLNFGGIIHSIKTPDKNGIFNDIVLGFENPKDYFEEHPYFGAIVGRFANRIAQGRFELEGSEYILAQNNGSNHLHGGLSGFDKVFWDVKPLKAKNGIELNYISKNGEEGYPGNLSVTVTYILSDDNTLKVKYKAHTDKATVINLTQHSYFNLSGDFSKKVLDHELQIHAENYLPTDSIQIPTGNYQLVAKSPFDFRTPKTIGRDIELKDEQLEIGNGYDHCWVINNSNKKLVKAAGVYHRQSGRMMEVYTNQPGIQLYTGNFLNNTLPSKTGGTYGPRSGFCLETQHFPNAPNETNFPSTVLRPGETFMSETHFKFSVVE